MKTMTITEYHAKKMGRLKAKELETCQRHKVIRRDHADIFDAYEDLISKIAEVDKAEKNAREIFDKIATYDTELAFSMDMVVGTSCKGIREAGLQRWAGCCQRCAGLITLWDGFFSTNIC